MNLWRAWTSGPPNTRRVMWATSERELRKLAKNEWGVIEGDVKSLDVPTTKAELVKWLNDNVNHIAL